MTTATTTAPATPFTRLPDWQLRLEAFIAQRLGAPFAWGRNDCALFAADAVLALTGRDPAANLRGHRTARQAYRVLQRHGGLAGLASARLGPSMAASLAGVGDVVLVQMGKHPALGVCNGALVLGPSAQGMATAPMSSALMAWRVC